MVQIESETAKGQIEAAGAEQIFQSRTSIGEILGQRKKDRLGLNSTPVDVRAFDLPDHTVYSVYFSQAVLYGRQLIDLLSAAKNGGGDRYQQNRDAILADWQIVDNPNYGSNSRLISIHQSDRDVGPHFLEFIQNHRPKFQEAIRAMSEKEVKPWLRERSKTLVSRAQAIIDLAGIIKKHFFGDSRLFISVVSKNQELLSEWLKKNAQGVDFSMSPHNQEEHELINNAASLVIHDLPPELKTKLVDQADFQGRIYVFDTQRDPHQRNFSFGGNQFTCQYLGKNLLRVSIGNSWILLDINKYRSREIESHFEPQEDKGLIPHLVWTKQKNSSERTYFTWQLPNATCHIVDPRASSLLGLLVAAYFSPKERKQLEKSRSLEESRYNQGIYEAQIPVLVSLKRDLFLQGPVFRGIEEYLEGQRPRLARKIFGFG